MFGTAVKGKAPRGPQPGSFLSLLQGQCHLAEHTVCRAVLVRFDSEASQAGREVVERTLTLKQSFCCPTWHGHQGRHSMCTLVGSRGDMSVLVWERPCTPPGALECRVGTQAVGSAPWSSAAPTQPQLGRYVEDKPRVCISELRMFMLVQENKGRECHLECSRCTR